MASHGLKRQMKNPRGAIKVVLGAVFVLLSVLEPARAANPLLSGSLSAAVPAPKPSRFSYSGNLLLDTSRTLTENDHTSWTGTYDATLTAADTRLDMSYVLDASYTREYSYVRDDGSSGDFDWLMAIATKSWKSGKHYADTTVDRVFVGLLGMAPVGADARRQTFRGSVGPRAGFELKYQRLDFVQTFTYLRGFYEYDIRDDGKVNSPDQFKSKTQLTFEITKEWSLQYLYKITHAVSFQGVGRSNDSSIFEIDYAPMKNLALGLGFATVRPTTLDTADGQKNTLKAFDQDNATAYFDTTLSF